MSKVSKVEIAKTEQGYRMEPSNCKTCANRQYERALPEWMVGNSRYDKDGIREQHMREARQRCGIGGFAIKLSATCERWSKQKGGEA